MKPGLEIAWAGERLVLLPQRAVYWVRAETLILADPHFGKAAAFRSAGVPVPAGSTRAGLTRLSDALNLTGARRLVIIGDFLHARSGRADGTMRVVSDWRSAAGALGIVLVRGNHDLGAGDPPEAWGIQCVSEPWTAPPFAFRHAPADGAGEPTFAGHVHPLVLLADRVGTSLRLPCFVFGDRLALLPAFGPFTGGRCIRPGRDERVFAVADEVLEVGAGR